MPKLILYAGFGAILFAIAAGASWYLQQKLASEPEVNPPSTAPGTLAGQPPARAAAAAADADAGSSHSADQALPIAIRPRSVSPEEILRYSNNLGSREKALQAREEAFLKDQTQLTLVMEDIRRERRELEALQTQVQGRIATVERLLAELTAKRQEADAERRKVEQELKTMKESQTEYKQSEKDNLKRLSEIFQNMDPEKAAGHLRALSNEGNLEMAVQLLGNFEEREAAKILEAVNDPTLITQLMDKFRGLKRSTKKTTTP